MILLQKLPISDAMQGYIEELIAKYAFFLISNEEIPKAISDGYNCSAIKDSLKLETHEKCAYCESKMLHVEYGDIEHITPKRRNPRLRFEYSNLTLACTVCNTRKSVHEDILNPYISNPSEHLMAHGPAIFRRSASNVGMLTEKRLDLNRPQLLQKRHERLQALQQIADQISRTSDPSIRSVLIEELRAEGGSEKEFSLVARAYIAEILSQLGIPTETSQDHTSMRTT